MNINKFFQLIDSYAATVTKTTNVQEQSAATTKITVPGERMPTSTNTSTIESITTMQMTTEMTPPNGGK